MNRFPEVTRGEVSPVLSALTCIAHPRFCIHGSRFTHAPGTHPFSLTHALTRAQAWPLLRAHGRLSLGHPATSELYPPPPSRSRHLVAKEAVLPLRGGSLHVGPLARCLFSLYPCGSESLQVMTPVLLFQLLISSLFRSDTALLVTVSEECGSKGCWSPC